MAIKRKFFIACVAIALTAALFSGVFAIMGWGSLLPRVGGTLMYPFQWLTAKVGDGVAGFSRYFADIGTLQDEIKSLKEENESLKSALVDAEMVLDESAWLYRYLSMKEENQDYTFCAATVIASAAVSGAGGDYVTSVTLNKGSTSGISAGMPVVTARGLVGVVVEVGAYSCRVTTLLDPSAAVGAVTSRGGERGLCMGDYAHVQSGRAVLRQLAEEADVVADDIVVSSGQGSVYPYGIPIGRVESVSANALNRTTEATVVPFTDFADLDRVLIMTAFSRNETADPADGGAA